VNIKNDSNECLFCASKNFSQVRNYSKIKGISNNFESQVVKCSDCGGLFMAPYVSKELLASIYSKGYFSGDDEDRLEVDLDNESLRKSSGSSNDHFLLSRDNGKGQSYDEASRSRTEKFRFCIRELKSIHPTCKNILDVGTANGDFLSIAREEGLDISGVEYSEYAARNAEKKLQLKIFCGDILDLNPPKKFDLIHLNHVYEHVISPRAVAIKLGSLLADDGLLYIEVPFEFNLVERFKSKIFGKNYPFNHHSIHHTVFYRPENLNKLFFDAGLEVVKSEVFHWRRYPTQKILGKLKGLLWWLISLSGQGLYIEAIYRKKG
jgi:2-polyprenyl-3-methyl-5-hydroxy-6-metoxy-1,4-benzoquinol methylase